MAILFTQFVCQSSLIHCQLAVDEPGEVGGYVGQVAMLIGARGTDSLPKAHNGLLQCNNGLLVGKVDDEYRPLGGNSLLFQA